MQGDNRRESFLLSGTAVVFIFVIICLNTNRSFLSTPGPFQHWTEYLPFLALNLSAFVCSLLLQAEEILTIYRGKKSFIIRKELIVLGAVYFLLGFEKYWCLLLIPNQLANLHTDFAMITIAVFLAGTMDIVFMFASGALFVRAFHPEDVPRERKPRKRYLLTYVSLLFLIVLVGYFRIWIFLNMRSSDWALYGYNLIDIFSVFVYFLILQVERIIPAVRQRKTLQVQWGLIALSVVSIFLAILWVAMNLQESPSPIVQNLRGSDLWKAAYSFAAAIFFVRAFRVKKETETVI